MFEASFQVSKVGSVNVATLQLPEMMDSQEFDRLNEDMLTAVSVEAEGRWVLDLSNLIYMGSSSLGLMVNVRQRIKQVGGELVLCHISPPLMKILRTCCLERLFLIARTREDAVDRLRD